MPRSALSRETVMVVEANFASALGIYPIMQPSIVVQRRRLPRSNWNRLVDALWSDILKPFYLQRMLSEAFNQCRTMIVFIHLLGFSGLSV